MEGFETPIRRSLAHPILLGGAPREFAILNGTLGCVLVLSCHSVLGIPIALTTHALAVLLAKHDPQFLETFKRHIHHKGYYEV